MIYGSQCVVVDLRPGLVVSVGVPVWEFTWIDALGGKPVAVVLDWVRLVGAFLPVDHKVIEVDDPARAVVMPVVLWVITEVFIRHMDLMTIGLIVTQFVDGVGQAVGFDDQEERRVAAAEFQQPCLAEPAIGIQDGDVGQVVSLELAGCRDLHRFAPLGWVFFTPTPVVSSWIMEPSRSCLPRRRSSVLRRTSAQRAGRRRS